MNRKHAALLILAAILPLASCGEAEDKAALAAKKDAAKAISAEDEGDSDDPWARTMSKSSASKDDQDQGADASFNVSGGESDNDGNDGGEAPVEDDAPDVVEQGPVSNAMQ